jgi:alpha-ketoglutarate-dependent taurine dioxygenase
VNNITLEIDGAKGLDAISESLQKSWGKHLIYHIYNVAETDYVPFYENLAGELGRIEDCRPVNDKSKKFSKSRDIRPDPDLYHFYAANTRQPLHTDYAYFPSNKSPDWVLMYCLDPSEFGGTTRFLSAHKLKKIMIKYNPALLKKLSMEVTWSYVGADGDEIHRKPIMIDEQINWNYWQIKSNLNNELVMKVREEFFKFLEDVIMAGNIYDFSKVWKRGDVVIFNDKKMLHGRDSFLGHRWLKDHAIFNHD